MKTRILLDANVLYGCITRDTFIHLAANGVVEARWTNQIHDEWIAALLGNRADLTRDSLLRVRDLMNIHAENSLVTGYEPLIEKTRFARCRRPARFGGSHS